MSNPKVSIEKVKEIIEAKIKAIERYYAANPLNVIDGSANIYIVQALRDCLNDILAHQEDSIELSGEWDDVHPF